jgi:hypothetical protein
MNLKKMLPFLEDDELKELAERLIESPDGTYEGVSMKEVLPFMEDEEVDKMLVSAYQKGQLVSSFLPFASDGGLSKLVAAILADPEEPKISLRSLLPFLEEEDLQKLGDKILASDGHYGDLSYATLLPYMDDEDIDEVFLQMATSGDPAAKSLAPFASEEAFHELVARYLAGSLADFDFDAYYPFMDDDDIRSLFHKAQNG